MSMTGMKIKSEIVFRHLPGQIGICTFPSLDVFPGLTHFVTQRGENHPGDPFSSFNLGRHSGEDLTRVMRNRAALCRALSIPSSALVQPRQVHGNEVLSIPPDFLSWKDTEQMEYVSRADGLVTDLPRVCLAVSTADCVPLLFYDSRRRVIGASHAGWRGTVGQFTDWPISGYMAVILAAFVGACVILGLIIYFSAKVKNNVMLLIIGIMIGYLASSVISILNYYSSTDRVHAFVMWGLGNFSGVSLEQLPFFGTCALIGLLLAILLIKPLNALLLGEMYAANLGIRIKRTRIAILLCTGVLTATTTAFCGPISFVGLAVPHIARLMLGSSNHKMLVPVTMLTGSCVALLCNMLMVVPGSNTILPLNAVTPMLGAPVIIYVIVNRKNIQYFN